MYKVYATILQRRLAEGVEAAQLSTQYGFRTSRSTSSAIYCIRRIQDMFERGGRRGHVLLLDLEKTFDRVHMDRVAEVLRRIGVPGGARGGYIASISAGAVPRPEWGARRAGGIGKIGGFARAVRSTPTCSLRL